jgi:hypothetical protein
VHPPWDPSCPSPAPSAGWPRSPVALRRRVNCLRAVRDSVSHVGVLGASAG